ncbi:hypothetical protein [uncultured Parasphingorhabdus sp.]|uniref:hypothetical protein n=1 Tax=uncultured Parasphingorhabdus sp. TaxID=2709694 RepID=UPI002AA7E0B5|nr:hypothetical protein [uncultured Parasphingorhabdus sp.]
MSFALILMALAQGWTVYGPIESEPLTNDQAQYAYLMCVGSKIEGLAKSTQDNFDEIFLSAKALCEENTNMVLESAMDKSAAESKIVEADLLMQGVGQKSVDQIRARDRDFIENLENDNNAEN